MTVLVTGGTGHLGANLVRRLIADGHDTRVLALPGSDLTALTGLDVHVVLGDLRKPDTLPPAVEGCKRIYHCAATVSTRKGSEQELFECNVLGTRNILSAARQAGVDRVVVTGSASAIGSPARSPIQDGDPFDPFAKPPPYVYTKHLAYHECLRAVADGLDVVLVAPTAMVGPNDFQPSPVGDLLLRLARGGLRALPSGGYSYAAMRDVVAGHLLAMERGRTGHTYLLSTEFLTTRELFELCARVLGRSRRTLTIPNRLAEAAASIWELCGPRSAAQFTPAAVRMLRMQLRVDCGKAIEELGYRPTGIRQAVVEAYECFAKRGLIERFDPRRPTAVNQAGALVRPSVQRAVDHLISLQEPDGSWEGESVWNTMILSQYVIVRKIVGKPIDDDERRGIIRQYEVTRTPEGGWGMHRESSAYVYFTTLAYVALRLLAVPSDHSLTAGARRWLHEQPGGVRSIPEWGKFWLSLIGVEDYRWVNPLLPELHLHPKWFPYHPDRWFCHTRQIFLGMTFLYGIKFQADLGRDLRDELLGQHSAKRFPVSKTDLYIRPGRLLRTLNLLARVYERFHSSRWRRLALNHCLAKIVSDQRSTNYRGISPVNALLNCLALHASGHPDLTVSLNALSYWRREDAAEGVRFVGARSAGWDTAFVLDCLAHVPGASTTTAASRAVTWLRENQIVQELAAGEAQDPVLGGWCFSNGTDRWPVSDCTAEAATALLKWPGSLDSDRIRMAVEFILHRQNSDGGFSTYERQRGPLWLEALNASEMFANCMLDRSYAECTGSALSAFDAARPYCDKALQNRLDDATSRAVAFLRRRQRPEGSFEGSWGINFTYATFFAIRGLRAAGIDRSDPSLRGAANWLIGAQRPDGGWGEHWTSSMKRSYVEHRQSQPAMTAWAVLGLLEIGGSGHEEPVDRGIKWLCDAQLSDGSWGDGAVTGVFSRTGLLDYRLYPVYFPALALACYVASPTVRANDFRADFGFGGGR